MSRIVALDIQQYKTKSRRTKTQRNVPDQGQSDNIPEFLKSTAELHTQRQRLDHETCQNAATTHLATSDRRAEWEVADTDFLIHDGIGKVIPASRHGSYEDGDGVRLGECGQEPGQPHCRCIARKGCQKPPSMHDKFVEQGYILNFMVFTGR